MAVSVVDVVITCRIVCLLAFLYYFVTIHITIQSCFTFLLFIASIFVPRVVKLILTKPPKEKEKSTKEILKELYPLKSSEDLDHSVMSLVTNLVTYDAEDVPSLENFSIIKQSTECIFARKSKIWGSKEWRENLTLEENIFRMVPTFLKFTAVCRQKRVDGFVIEIPKDPYCDDIHVFGETIRRILQTISDYDPRNMHCMDKSYVGKHGWVFEFNSITFFITSFAPFYPETNSRYSFGAENAFLLFQPEISFAIHNIPTNTTETNWENPKTVRDFIRVAFRNACRGYDSEKLKVPPSHEVLKPIEENDQVIEWWVKPSN